LEPSHRIHNHQARRLLEIEPMRTQKRSRRSLPVSPGPRLFGLFRTTPTDEALGLVKTFQVEVCLLATEEKSDRRSAKRRLDEPPDEDVAFWLFRGEALYCARANDRYS
jgi:hypothetical protein